MTETSVPMTGTGREDCSWTDQDTDVFIITVKDSVIMIFAETASIPVKVSFTNSSFHIQGVPKKRGIKDFCLICLLLCHVGI